MSTASPAPVAPASAPAAPIPVFAPQQNVNQAVNVQIVAPSGGGKSVFVAFLLTFLFGPLGMFYSTVGGATVMLIVSIVLAVPTLGGSLILTWPICMLWGCLAASRSRRGGSAYQVVTR